MLGNEQIRSKSSCYKDGHAKTAMWNYQKDRIRNEHIKEKFVECCKNIRQSLEVVLKYFMFSEIREGRDLHVKEESCSNFPCTTLICHFALPIFFTEEKKSELIFVKRKNFKFPIRGVTRNAGLFSPAENGNPCSAESSRYMNTP